MKNNKRHIRGINLFLTFILIFVCVLSVNGAYDDNHSVDGGANLVAQGAFTWAGANGNKTIPANCYSDDQKFYVSGDKLEYNSGGKFRFLSNVGLGFKLIGGKTYQITLNFEGRRIGNTDYYAGMRVLEGATFASASVIANFYGADVNGDVSKTIAVTPHSDNTYWISGNLPSNATIFSSLVVTEANLQTIISSTTWPSSDSENVSLVSGGIFGSSHFMNVGTDKEPIEGTTITTNAWQTYKTYDFSADNNYINFQLTPGSGLMRVYYKDAPEDTPYSRNTTTYKSDILSLPSNPVLLDATANGAQITFTRGKADNAGYPAYGWDYRSDGTTAYAGKKLDVMVDNPNGLEWYLTVVYKGEGETTTENSSSHSTASGSLSVDIDANKTVLFFFIKTAGLALGEAKTITVQMASITDKNGYAIASGSLRYAENGTNTIIGNTISTQKTGEGDIYPQFVFANSNKISRIKVGLQETPSDWWQIVYDNNENLTFSQYNNISPKELEISLPYATGAFGVQYVVGGGKTASIKISSLEVEVVTSETPAIQGSAGNNKTTVLKTGADYASATQVGSVSTGHYSTKVVSYNFYDSEATSYYVSGGLVGAIEVKYDYNCTDLPAITEDVVWYGFGKNLWTNPSGDYFAFNTDAWPFSKVAGSENPVTMNVNGNEAIKTNLVDPNVDRQAVAFKLATGFRYRIQIFSDYQGTGKNILKTTSEKSSNYSLASATYYNETASGFEIKDNNWDSYSPTTYVWTYEINNESGTSPIVCWIDPSNNGEPTPINIGAIEVFPYKYSGSIPSDVSPISHTGAIKLEDFKTSQFLANRNSESGDAPQSVELIRKNYNSNNLYLYGPTMMMNDTKPGGSYLNICPEKDLSNQDVTAVRGKSIMLNNGNAIGLKLPPNAKVTVNYCGKSGKIAIRHGENLQFGNINKNDAYKTSVTTSGSGSNYSVQYYNTTNKVEDVWITGSDYDFAYVAGVYVEIDPTKMQTITSDYYLYPAGNGNGSAAPNTLTDDKHIKYLGTSHNIVSGNGNLTIPDGHNSNGTTTNGYYEMSSGDAFGFKLLAGKTGKIKVYYTQNNELDAAMGSGAATYNPATRTISFPGNDGGENEYGRNMKGWWFGAQDFTGKTQVTITFDTSTFPFEVIAQAQGEQVGVDKDNNPTYETLTLVKNVAVGKSSITFDLAEVDPNTSQAYLDVTKITQIYLHSSVAGQITIRSAIIGGAQQITLGTGTDETNPATGYSKVSSRISNVDKRVPDTPYGVKTTTMTYPFNHTSVTSDVLYWVKGEINIAAIEIIYDEDVEELETSKGENGYIYINRNSATKAFPFSPRYDYWGKDVAGSSLIQIKSGGSSSTDILKFMPGTTHVYIYRNKEFQFGGARWNDFVVALNQGGNLNKIVTSFACEHMQSANATGDKKIYDVTYEVNANPQTECNGGIGGKTTENGGMFLQPISGDFFRFEPEYDGVVTMWILQNGNTDGSTADISNYQNKGSMRWGNGRLTRRPCYVVDENGYVMRRSTVKPSFDYDNSASHYAINGTWADINWESPIRDDYADAWKAAMRHWSSEDYTPTGNEPNGDWKTGTDSYGERYKETMRFYDFWYDGGTYTFDFPGDNITLDDWVVEEQIDPNASSDLKGKTTTLTSNTSVLTQDQQIGLIVYGSDRLRELEIEKGFLASGQNDFSKYGYEVPVHIHVRYVFPVRAGKTYYLGGRGTKNGFMGAKFEPMPANYDPKSYINESYNYKVSDGPQRAKYMLSSITGNDLPTSRETYDKNSVDTYISGYDDIPVITLDEEPGESFSWTEDVLSDWTDFAERGRTVTFKLKREFTANKWHPIVLPFSVSESKLREIFGEKVQVLYLDPYAHTLHNSRNSDSSEDWISVINPAVKNQKLSFTRHYYQMLYANTPAYICPSQTPTTDTDGYVTFERVHLEKANLGDNDAIGYKIGEQGDYEYWITGSYAVTNAGSGDMYYLDNVNGVATLYHSQSGVKLKATRCWIETREKSSGNRVTHNSAPKLFEIGFGIYNGDPLDDDADNVAAGIEDIVMDDIMVEKYNDDNVYDMMGRIVGKGSLEGLRTGVYIFHGRKVYVR